MLLNDRPSSLGGLTAKAAGVILLCCLSGIIGAAVSNGVGSVVYRMSYADFVSILLTAVSVLITILAIMLAIAGVMGWSSIEKKVEEGVHGRVDKILSEEFKDGGRWDRVVEEKTNRMVEEKTSRIVNEKTSAAMDKLNSEVYQGIQEDEDDEVSSSSGKTEDE